MAVTVLQCRIFYLLSLANTCACLLSFSNFQFAPNGVCIRPRFFIDNGNMAKAIVTDIHQHENQPVPKQQRRFTMRNVPGDGDCMFLAVALATLASMGLGGNDTLLLRAISRETRSLVARILDAPHGGGGGSGELIIDNDRSVQASKLLASAARDEKMSTAEYLRRLRLEGREGGLYGGGPELTVLSNLLRRPISIYHLANDDGVDGGNDSGGEVVQSIECQGVFGAQSFADPLVSALPDSAVLKIESQPGAFSWHLHILVVDFNREKHACVLLPQSVRTNDQT